MGQRVHAERELVGDRPVHSHVELHQCRRVPCSTRQRRGVAGDEDVRPVLGHRRDLQVVVGPDPCRRVERDVGPDRSLRGHGHRAGLERVVVDGPRGRHEATGGEGRFDRRERIVAEVRGSHDVAVEPTVECRFRGARDLIEIRRQPPEGVADRVPAVGSEGPPGNRVVPGQELVERAVGKDSRWPSHFARFDGRGRPPCSRVSSAGIPTYRLTQPAVVRRATYRSRIGRSRPRWAGRRRPGWR